MTFPNPELGSFEGENGDWCHHVSQNFLQDVTIKMLQMAGIDPAHAAVAHLNGAIVCAMVEGGSPEMMKRFREAIEGFEAGDVSAEYIDKISPLLTVIRGGKKD